MGLLDDLLRQLQEAADAQRQQSAPTRGLSEQAKQEMQRAFARSRPKPKPEPVEAPISIQNNDQTDRLIENSAPVLGHSETRKDHPLAARLRAPGGIRDAVIMAEILRRPGARR